jgi:hypothetical protein
VLVAASRDGIAGTPGARGGSPRGMRRPG